MKIESITGDWELIGTASINSEISFIEEEPEPDGVKNWLNGRAEELIKKTELTSGLTLRIDSEGNFTEKKDGNPEIEWFDSEGVLEPEVIPFDGVIKIDGSGAYIVPKQIPSWAEPSKIEYGVILRYDDSDTKICDRIEKIDGKLIRTMSVVTDELYLNRVVIVYKKN